MNEVSIAALGSDELCEALRAAGCQLRMVRSTSQLFARKSDPAPRLIVIEASFVGSGEVPQVIRTVRASLPLTDTVVWAAGGSASLVRSAFLAGAKDVVVNKSPRKLIEVANQVIEDQQILPKVHDLAKQRSRSSRFESMLSRSGEMWDLFEQCTRVAPSGATVLIIGETGTGKELLARAMHRRSGRKGRFVACNCGSISEQLIESELFGHEKGAFTGAARQKKGLVRHAHEGTLFLDEIGDMPENVQVNLLRLLQEKTVRPVGGHEELPVDVRIVAATNVPLDDAVAEGRFREDLFYRLDVIRFALPPLRDRPEDIVFLFGHFLKQLAKHYGAQPPVFSDSFLDTLVAHDWPGNVRELENFAERVVLSRTQRSLAPRDFSRLIQAGRAEKASQLIAAPRRAAGPAPPDLDKTLEDNITPMVQNAERRYLEDLLAANQGRIAETAEQAGISRRTLLRKLKTYNIDKKVFKP